MEIIFRLLTVSHYYWQVNYKPLENSNEFSSDTSFGLSDGFVPPTESDSTDPDFEIQHSNSIELVSKKN